ncbi:hypothetical protein [Emticicia sp. BO119]|uniref:hypothetical protein n=1 Tax=Emticicia sp. BO119 TaxID=2757768 RepID=UPI0015F09684|nr:hypothetical protein [Emticicia sp. BO119]MBA4851084.1 hypothetical protein [Emticicia sp. BO119]
MKKLIMIAMLVAGAIGANAQRGYDKRDGGRYGRNDNVIESYQFQARNEIAQGIKTGRITSNEAKKLLREAERIEVKENRFKRDGRLDNFERRELEQDLAVLHSWIAREKRDRDRVTYEDYSRGYASGRYNDRYGKRF